LLDEFAADDEHAARAAGGVVDAHAGRGLDDADHEANDVAGRVEIATFLARRLGKHVDEKFVGRAKEVGELEILVAEAVAAEVADEVLAAIVGDEALVALGLQEADVVEDVFEGFIRFAQRAQRRVEDAAVGHGGVIQFVLEVLPAGTLRDEEAVVEIGVFAVLGLGIVQRQALLDLARDDPFILRVEDIGAAFEEEHAEDVVLVGGSIEALLAQAVRGGVEVAFELGEGELRHGSVTSSHDRKTGNWVAMRPGLDAGVGA
jgi:hypothetical protein